MYTFYRFDPFVLTSGHTSLLNFISNFILTTRSLPLHEAAGRAVAEVVRGRERKPEAVGRAQGSYRDLGASRGELSWK